MTISKAAIGIFLAAAVFTAACSGADSQKANRASSPRHDYEISVPSNARLEAIPFTFPLPVSDRPVSVYVGLDRALILTAVTIDGKPSLAKAIPTRIDFYGPDSVSIKAESYTYLVTVVEGLAFVPQEFASSPEPYFATLRFPREWSEIELRYKIRFPDKTFTREFALRISRIPME